MTSFLKYLEMGSLTAPWEMFGEILSSKALLLAFIFRAASLFSGLFRLYVAILIELSVPGRFNYTLNFSAGFSPVFVHFFSDVLFTFMSEGVMLIMQWIAGAELVCLQCFDAVGWAA